MKHLRFIVVSFIFAFILSVASFAETAYDGYIVSFKDKGSAQKALEYTQNQEVCLFSSAEEQALLSINESLDVYKTYDENLVTELDSMGLVEYCEPDYICELFDYDFASEEGFSKQWSHEITGIEYAWNLGIYGNNVNVAVIDTGILDNHEDFTQANILDGYNFSSDDTTDTNDTNGHGTSVSGVIASAVNQKGCVGVAHRANIIPIRITSSGAGITISSIAKALEDAVQIYGADVINLSLGYVGNKSEASAHLKSTIETLQAQSGVIVVAAAGNIKRKTANVTADSTKDEINAQYSSSNFDENGNVLYAYPASFDCVISVANLSKNTSDGSYTYSGTSRYNDKVTICAPGSNIYTPYKNSDSSYITISGTSFACPYISGVAALAKSVNQNITPKEFESLLTQTANKSVLGPAEQRNDHYGYGIVDVQALIKAIISEKSKGGFISPVDRTENGNITVKIHNSSSEETDISLFAETFSPTVTRPLGFFWVSKKLAAGEIKEIDITSLSDPATALIRCYLFESLLFKPIYIPVSE